MAQDILTLGLDVDGVLLDYKKGFFAYLNSIGITPACSPDEVSSFGFSNALPGVEKDVIYKMIIDFSQSDHFSNLPPYSGAIEGLELIKEHFGDDIRLVAITSAGSSEVTHRLRKKNLEAFPLEDITILPLGADKSEHLKRLGERAVFIDDLYSHVISAENVGVRGILFRQLYNEADDHDLVIQDWSDAGLNTIFTALEEKMLLRKLAS